MKMTAIGRSALEAREGVRLEAYQDSVGVWTIGVGHTSACGAPFPGRGVKITQAEADAAFARDLARFENAVSTAVKVPLDDHQFDALVSIAFNIGTGWFGAGGHQTATFVKRLNLGDVAGATEHIMDFVIPSVIVGRRKAEQDQFCTPYSVGLPRPVISQPRILAPAGPPIPGAPATPPPASVPTTSTQPIASQPASSGLFAALSGLFRRSA